MGLCSGPEPGPSLKNWVPEKQECRGMSGGKCLHTHPHRTRAQLAANTCPGRPPAPRRGWEDAAGIRFFFPTPRFHMGSQPGRIWGQRQLPGQLQGQPDRRPKGARTCCAAGVSTGRGFCVRPRLACPTWISSAPSPAPICCSEWLCSIIYCLSIIYPALLI